MSTSYDPSCIFCRVVAGEVPSTGEYSSGLVYAFADLHPVAPVHVLVVPRQHIADASKVTLEHGAMLVEMLEAARAVAEHHGISESGYRLVFNVGADSGAEVPHLHMHVLGGRRLGWPPG
ncbi:MAG: histidine triad nucleotide-binding protein [Acidimicrobiales bacterium]